MAATPGMGGDEAVHTVDAIVADLHAAMRNAAGGAGPEMLDQSHRGTGWVSYRLRSADLRRIMREFRPRTRALALNQRLALAAALLAEQVGDMGHSAIFVLADTVKELGPEHFQALDEMAGEFMGWSHVDQFCIDVMQPLLWAFPVETLALLKAWNGSPNQWKRRSSVVTFTRKVGESGAFTNEALALCDNLIWDQEDLVQKGVGWALKDNMRSAHQRVVAYVKELRRMGVTSTITLYAIRDLKGPERADVLAVKQAGETAAAT